MSITFTVLGILLFGIAGVAISLIRKRARRNRLLRKPLPEAWEIILENRVHFFRNLPEGVRGKLAGLIQVFLAEKHFEACGGLEEITDEIRLVVAAQACLLLVGMERHGFFPRLKSILIYPGAYRDRRRRTFHLPTERNDEVRFGESWDSGSVVLAWANVLAGAAHDDDGMNVVFHEFAHQLDQVDGAADGAPPLPRGGNYSEWSRIFSREYDALVAEADDPRSEPLLDPYGATDPAEFFAVATEAFFEQPGKLKNRHRELYEQLVGYFGVDPAGWR